MSFDTCGSALKSYQGIIDMVNRIYQIIHRLLIKSLKNSLIGRLTSSRILTTPVDVDVIQFSASTSDLSYCCIETAIATHGLTADIAQSNIKENNARTDRVFPRNVATCFLQNIGTRRLWGNWTLHQWKGCSPIARRGVIPSSDCAVRRV